jgi:translation initiation factor 2 subunit 3
MPKKTEKAAKKPAKKEPKEEVLIVEPIQPAINIGLVGHVDHGKTTLTEKLTGKWTDTHSEEIKRGITIRLGYADSVFRKCPKCKGYKAYTTKLDCPECTGKSIPLRKVSFVDAPGHESLMATMLSGAAIMDGAILLIAANERCPQPQTREHLMALQICGIKNIVIVQNKIDLVSHEDALKNYNEIKKFIKGTPYENSPIIPVSAQHDVNIHALVQAIEETIPTPDRDSNKDPIMFIARSFDINKPGIVPDKLKGGVLGGALKQGKLKVGDLIELRPGRITQEQNKTVAKPITAEIVSLVTGGTNVNEVTPGGSIGVLTKLDPGIVKSDSLAGNILGLAGKLPNILYNLRIEVHLLERVVGAKDELVVEPIKMAEILMLNVNSSATVGFVTKLTKNEIECRLKIPVCAEIGSRITISRRIGNRFRLIGYGILKG